MTIEDKAHEAHNANRGLKEKYHIPYKAWIDWFTLGYRRAEKDMKERQSTIKVHCLTRKPGDQTYFFTKDEKHCLCIDYKSEWDFGNGSPSGARLYEVEIHTNNAFKFQYIPEIQLHEVPECILELLSYLK